MSPVSRRCLTCRRAVHGARDRCLYCGGGVEHLVETALVSCPRCQHTMGKVDHGPLLVDLCGQCGGSWYDRDELDVVLASACRANMAPLDPAAATADPIPAGQPDAILKCPHCRQGMTRRNYGRLSGVIVDVCLHGAFLDAGELSRLQAFIATGGAERGQARRADEERADAPIPGFDDSPHWGVVAVGLAGLLRPVSR